MASRSLSANDNDCIRYSGDVNREQFPREGKTNASIFDRATEREERDQHKRVEADNSV
jgi:hypothetical protein